MFWSYKNVDCKKGGHLQPYGTEFLHTLSSSCIMARWRPTFRTETSRQVTEACDCKVICCVTGNISSVHCDWYTNGKFSNRDASKFHPLAGHEDADREYRYSSTPSLTSELGGDGLSEPRTGCFTSGKEMWYLLCRRLVGPQGRCGRVRNISPPPAFDHRTVRPVASR